MRPDQLKKADGAIHIGINHRKGPVKDVYVGKTEIKGPNGVNPSIAGRRHIDVKDLKKEVVFPVQKPAGGRVRDIEQTWVEAIEHSPHGSLTKIPQGKAIPMPKNWFLPSFLPAFDLMGPVIETQWHLLNHSEPVEA